MITSRIRGRHAAWAAAGALLVATALTMVSASTAANTVPSTRAGSTVGSVSFDHGKPSECSGIAIEALVQGSGQITVSTSSGRTLVLGSPIVDVMVGGLAADCILGGGGDDQLNGNGGNDVCIGGPGTDTFVSCEVSVQDNPTYA